MWTRHERRSALARALEQRTAYILPVRLDDAELMGLSPTIGYIDARVVGAEGIVNATLAKLSGTPSAETPRIARVPRTEAERQQLLLQRPSAWEYLYFAAQLLHERNSVEDKYLDYEIHYAPSTREVVQKEEVLTYILQRFHNVQRLIDMMSTLVNNSSAWERAFGTPGESGDPAKLAHLARRFNSSYEEFMDWAASIRGVNAPSEFHKLLNLLANFADPPVEEYRRFVDDYVTKVDAIPAALAAGQKVRLEMTLVIALPGHITRDYSSEFDRMKDHLTSR